MANAIEFEGASYTAMEVIIEPSNGFWLFGYGSVVWKVGGELK
jgi:cation transport regulator ChaC